MKSAPENKISRMSNFFGRAAASPKKPAPSRPQSIRPSRKNLYEGPADLVAAQVAWGEDMLWPSLILPQIKPDITQNGVPGDALRGLLAAGLGGYGHAFEKHHDVDALFEFDWRTPIHAWRAKKNTNHAKKNLRHSIDHPALVQEINLNTPFILAGQFASIYLAEPVLTLQGPAPLPWIRLALMRGGRFLVDEMVLDAPSRHLDPGEWTPAWRRRAVWKKLDEQLDSIRTSGFQVWQNNEQTGPYLLHLRRSIEDAQMRGEALFKAINIAPELENVGKLFKSELKAAKKRLIALERGVIAVYRIEAVKPRAEELI